MHKKAYKYRIYPTSKQEKTMLVILDSCRWLWNQFVGQRKTLWEKDKKGISCYEQIAELPKFAEQNPALENVYSQTKQNVAVRVDLAFKAFFRRCKAGENPGYPRFKGKNWYDSFTYPQCPKSGSPFQFVEDNSKIYLSKIGCVKIRYHRKLEGTSKTCTVKKTSTGKWYVVIVCENVPAQKVKSSAKQAGIDVGLITFATLSDGGRIENPRFFKQEERALAKSQRKLFKQEKGTPQRARARKVVARVYERIRNRRDDFTHQQSKRIVDGYVAIAVEDLNIRSMVVKNQFPAIRKGIADIAWKEFLVRLAYKAENAGRQFIAINPAYTSQDCSGCGNRQVIKLSDRQYVCPVCGLKIDRDLNAAKNILSVGLHTLAMKVA